MVGTAPNYFNGDVLIGATSNSLSTKLFVNGDGSLRPVSGITLNLHQNANGSNASPISNRLSWFTTAPTECASIDVQDAKTNVNGVPMIFSTKDNSNLFAERMRIATGGIIRIGTATPDEKLTVKGKIHTQEVKVNLLGPLVPDYVFAKDYNLATLKEVELYINKNSHLPEIPSANEIEKNGLLLAEMNMKLLKKIEELTLYAIEQEKKTEKLTLDLIEQNKIVLEQNKRIEKLEKQ